MTDNLTTTALACLHELLVKGGRQAQRHGESRGPLRAGGPCAASAAALAAKDISGRCASCGTCRACPVQPPSASFARHICQVRPPTRPHSIAASVSCPAQAALPKPARRPGRSPARSPARHGRSRSSSQRLLRRACSANHNSLALCEEAPSEQQPTQIALESAGQAARNSRLLRAAFPPAQLAGGTGGSCASVLTGARPPRGCP